MATGLENLKIYQMAKEHEKTIYQLTAVFPKEEKYRRVDQMRRSSASVCDNIAESYGKYSFKEKIHKLYIARGEAEENRRQIERSANVELIEEKTAQTLVQSVTELMKAINGYIRFMKGKLGNETV